MNAWNYPAHIRKTDGAVQTVKEHDLHVAQYAENTLTEVSLPHAGCLAGVLHDMGKLSAAFRTYIQAAAEGEKVRRGSVNHTFAGVRYILEMLAQKGNQNDFSAVLTADMIAYAIGAHHGQFDCVDEDEKNGFDYRLNKDDIFYEEVKKNFIEEMDDEDELFGIYQKACTEVGMHVLKIKELAGGLKDREKKYEATFFFFGSLTRLIQSSLIDADRRDTAEFMGDYTFPEKYADISLVWKRELAYAEKKMAGFDQSTEINKARSVISAQCREAAESSAHLFRLNVPTGAGKTISSLRFALANAAKYEKKRIIFTAPLLSILEQNAAVIREYFDDQDLILEHHSNVVMPKTDRDELNVNELFVENWNAPVIITTLVQLLNTLFSGNTTSIRRFHSLVDSVIVIDEVQNVPDNMLSMFDLMISFLCEECGTTVVLCSATQPELSSADYPILVKAVEMVPYDPVLWEIFHRTDIRFSGRYPLESISEKVMELAKNTKSTLIICNKKDESEQLYRAIHERYTCYHLAASMCIVHRRNILEEIKRRLKEPGEQPVFCVSTQVMEAGVDISFEKVIRLLAGMDSIVQAAGRCNRNGESKAPGIVEVIECTDENLDMLSTIRDGKTASYDLIDAYEKNPDSFDNSLQSEKAVSFYYRNLYRKMKIGFQDFQIRGKNFSVFSLLSANHKLADNCRGDGYLLHQAFKLAGKYFHVFDDTTVDVLVPYGEGREIISDLCSARAKYDINFVKEKIHQARAYTVTIYPYQKRMLEKESALTEIEGLDIWLLSDGYYDENTGVVLQRTTTSYFEI